MIPLLLSLLFSPALAQEGDEAPEFLLGDVGVRIDLPDGWTALEWSDWHFKGETSDRSVMVSAWTTPVQIPVTAETLDLWSPLHLKHSRQFGGAETLLDSSELTQQGDHPVARYVMHFVTDKGGQVDLYGATVAVMGQDMHIMTLAGHQRRRRAEKALDKIVEKLEIHDAPVTLHWGAEVEASGVKTKLPDDWRTPIKRSEQAKVEELVAPMGVSNLADCWLALRPRGPSTPDVMMSCQGGMWLGVVDEYTFEDVDAALRPKVFGEAPVEPAAQVPLEDRVGFAYQPTAGLVMGIVPYDEGLSRTWILTGSDEPDNAELTASLTSTLQGSTYSGPHPASAGDYLTYYIRYRPTHPAVLCPALGLLGLLALGGVVVVGAGVGMRSFRKNPYEDFDEDE